MLRSLLITSFFAAASWAADFEGAVQFGALPLPGAAVIARQGPQSVSAITGPDGRFRLENLSPGRWEIEVSKQLFVSQRRSLDIPPTGPAEAWTLELLPTAELTRLATSAPAQEVQAPPPAPVPAAAAKKPALPPQEVAERAADSFLVNGSSNNGAASPFAQFPAFGNNRRNPNSLYNGNLGLIVNHSALDARNYSLTGQDTPKAQYSRFEGVFNFGGPLKIPRLLRRNGPQFNVNYQWTRNRNASVESTLFPTTAQRSGDLTGRPPALDPLTRQPFPNNRIPASRLSPQALALLPLYPLPNFPAGSGFNFQSPLRRGVHQDDLQSRLSKQIGRRDNLLGSFAFQSIRTDTPSLLQFLNTSSSLGLNATAAWRHSFHPRFFLNQRLEYSSLGRTVRPFFSERENISGQAGVTGNDQSPLYWGPPALNFSSGLASLRDAQYNRIRNQTVGYSADAFYNIGRHYLQFGATHRRQQFNVLAQQDPRGSFAFTGLAAGDDLAGFLLGVPDTSTIAFGNADKYLRIRTIDGFLNDDYRLNPGLTLNFGLRYEYASPASEKFGRLVNLALTPAFTSATQQLNLLPRPDRNNFSPRFGLAWRPFPASSLIIRGGYGIYYDSGIYSAIALEMAQQAPLSRNLRLSNSPSTPLTLAAGFPAAASETTFAVDPNFRVGYAQTWQLSIQRDLPKSLQATVTYNGSRASNAQQQILPNTFPTGAPNPCPTCPSGFNYLLSNGHANRHAAQFEIRRRLRAGFASNLSYTWAKSLDNAMLGGRPGSSPVIAHDWRNLSAERARSPFDQRHLFALQSQYTSGVGVPGGGLMRGWPGRFLRDWTLATQLNAGSGLPLTPIFFSPVRGSGVTGTLRPDFTGQPLYNTSGGRNLNPAAVAPPAPGRWGNAGRNSINGPSQFTMNASLARTFRSSDRFSMDFRVDAFNFLNTVNFPTWNTIVGNPQFGLPSFASPMRTIQSTFRTRF